MKRRNERGWHQSVEQYTPSGTLGRVLFALVGFPPSLFAFFGGLNLLTSRFVGLFDVVIGASFGTLGAVGCLLTLVVLWPVYLSAIGNVETPAAYMNSQADRETDALDDLAASSDERVRICKRLYAEGELSHEAFQRQMTALGADTPNSSPSNSIDGSTRDSDNDATLDSIDGSTRDSDNDATLDSIDGSTRDSTGDATLTPDNDSSGNSTAEPTTDDSTDAHSEATESTTRSAE